MQKRIYISGLLSAAIILSVLAAPAVAVNEQFSHSIRYDIGGRITIDRQLGFPCTSGAVKRQTVRGFGEMIKTEDVRIAPHIITVDEQTDWTTAEDAVRNLNVTTTIDLCARPMSAAAEDYTENGYNISEGDIISPYHPLVVSGELAVRSMTSQQWGVSITPDPGETGSLESDFIAAYGPGPHEEIHGQEGPYGFISYFDEDYRWWFSDEDDGIERGDYYVGNYFEIDQYAYTSGGEFSRFISMSSPFYGTYMEEELRVIGMAEVRDAFEMDNLEPGPKAITFAWYDLF